MAEGQNGSKAVETAAPEAGEAASNGRAEGSDGNAAAASKVQQPKPQALPARQGPSSILVSHRQRGNPILSNIKAVPWEWSDIPADFVLGQTTCALFLQLKYHRLHPEYIYQRIRGLGGRYNLRVLLTMVDIENHEDPLKEISKTSLINNLTLILCWSAKEAGHYLELYKSFEHASSASIRAPPAQGYSEKLTEFVTTPRSINKTDALSLVANFGSLREAMNANPEEIAMIGGWGQRKVQRWVSAVNEPFRTKRALKRRGKAPALNPSRSSASEGGGQDHVTRPVAVPTWKAQDEDAEMIDESDVEDEQMRMAREAEDEARAAAAAAAAAAGVEKPEEPPLRKTEDGLSEGITAALAKLREKK